MSEPAIHDDEVDALTRLGQQLIYAILYRGTLGEIQELIDAGSPVWYQTEDEGMSSLHAAAYGEREDVVELLIDEGALWNAVDSFQNTAADVALSLNNDKIYNCIRNAGVRAELLLSLLASRPSLPESSSALLLKATDSSAAGSTDAFLTSPLRFTRDVNGQNICMLDVGDQEVGVMMGWETPIMQETVRKLCYGNKNVDRGLAILNVGFGLGIIDGFFQSLSTPPLKHVIIEPHRDVLKRIRELGWYDKEGVKIIEGKWQDVITRDGLNELGRFDIVYTDTFSEHYEDLHRFFRLIPDLLADGESRFGFFNGLGATNALFYDVYAHLSELHLRQLGLSVEWSDVYVQENDEDTWGQTRSYFSVPLYRLPVVTLTSADDIVGMSIT